MIVAFPAKRSDGAAPNRKIGKTMDVILHIGAHRCATTSFQNYMRFNSDRLAAQGVGFWGPRRTRSGLFRGIQPGPAIATGRDLRRRGVGRVRLRLSRSAERGAKSLLVSDENMIGGLRENLHLGELYCGVGERMARFADAFGGCVGTVAVNIRSHETYWASALGFALARGRGTPGRATLARIASAPRGWREVITDLACAIPGAQIRVLPFETFAARPDAQLAALTGITPPMTHARDWLNATPRLPRLRTLAQDMALTATLPAGDGRWQPFDTSQVAALRETYADDLMWLTGGADGLARLARNPDKKHDNQAGQTPPDMPLTRGRRDDRHQGHMAGAG